MGGKQNICVILVLFLLIIAEWNVDSMWNELDVGDVMCCV